MSEIFTTGIEVKMDPESGWSASCEWQCGKFAESGCMQGTIETKYYENSLSEAIDYVLDCMKQMNVKRSDEIDRIKDVLGFALYSSGNPHEYSAIKEEASKRGWNFYSLEQEKDSNLEEDADISR